MEDAWNSLGRALESHDEALLDPLARGLHGHLVISTR